MVIVTTKDCNEIEGKFNNKSEMSDWINERYPERKGWNVTISRDGYIVIDPSLSFKSIIYRYYEI